MNARALCIGQFIAATDFGISGVINDREPTFTIGRCVRESMADMKKVGKEIEKGIVYFSDYPRGWVMNQTNRQCLTALFGDETDDWTGKRVTLHSEMVSVGPSKQPGIRVKGSPELTADLKVTIKLPKKAPITMTLVPTGPRRNVEAPAPMTEANFLRWLGSVTHSGVWTRDQVKAVLVAHGSADPTKIAPEQRAVIVEIVKVPPVAAPPADGAPDDEGPPEGAGTKAW